MRTSMVNIKNIDTMNEEIFLIDYENPKDIEIDCTSWWMNMMNHGSWIQGFLAYGGNPPHISMDKTGDPKFVEKIREEGGFSNMITGTLEKNSWYMNVSRSQEAFQKAASRAYKQKDDGNEPYWDKEDQEWGLQQDIFKHHPTVHATVEHIWKTYKPYFEEALGLEVKDYNNCYVHAFQHGDSSWAHQDYMDYSAIVYLNPVSMWDLRKWGGETLFFNEDIDYVRATTCPKGGSAVVFRGDIFHKVTGVSWEAPYPRNSATFFFDKK